MTTIEEKYPNITDRDHVLTKDMWAGTKDQVESTEFIIGADGVGRMVTVKYAPAWYKAIDEPIVNALDQFVREPEMRNLWITFDTNGRVEIRNDGPGIEVAIHKELNVYVPEMLFGMLFKGSNIRNDPTRIVGGTNGVGAKISNIYSSDFVIQTYDGHRGKLYVQKWSNRMGARGEPTIFDKSTLGGRIDLTTPHTKLVFRPDYTLFGYAASDQGMDTTLVNIVRTRAYLAAMYGHYCCDGRALKVWFNGAEIKMVDPPSAYMARVLFPGESVFSCVVTPVESERPKKSYQTHAWEITVVVLKEDNGGFNQLSTVNGVVVRGGKHTKKIFALITDAVERNIRSVFADKQLKFNKSYVTSYLFLVANCKVAAPAWTGQRKDELDTPIGDFAHYVLPSKFADSVAAKLRDHIIAGLMNQKDANIARNMKLEYDKYEPASNMAKPFSDPPCMLLASEGDSADQQIKIAFRNVAELNNGRYGFVSLGGVIMNARREVKLIRSMSGGSKLIKSRRLMENALFKALIIILGLNLNYKYDPKSPTYAREVAELKYSCIVGCVDQDLDGVGNIFSLLISMFEVIWPNLFAMGFIRRFATPIIRAFPRSSGKVRSFYSETEYNEWAATLTDSASYNVVYYKGLGSHNREESIQMVKMFTNSIITYTLDAESHTLFETYYGKDPDLRKQVLSKPTKVPTKDDIMRQMKDRRISCSEHLNFEANRFQKDSIERHLDSAIDGFNQATRKIYHGAMYAFRTKNNPVKVAQLAGEVARREDYHHGENVLGDSIKKQAFVAVGGKQLPILVPYGNFGSRACGGAESASARYVRVKFNASINDLIYPAADYQLLPFTFEEGRRSTPEYFVPIIPTAITESNSQPGHGWKIRIWAKDAIDIIDKVRLLIRADVYCGEKVGNITLPEPKPCTEDWSGRMFMAYGQPHSAGRYTISGPTVIITELPYRVWTNIYVKWLKHLAEGEPNVIASINDRSNDMEINIIVKLHPEATDIIAEKYPAAGDPIEMYFGLVQPMTDNINLIGARHEVIEFASYAAVIKYWYPIRRDMYVQRLNRQRILLELRILHQENILRYIEEINDAAEHDMDSLVAKLANRKFDRFNSALLADPDFLPTDQLRAAIVNGSGASYNYLVDLTDRTKVREAVVRRKDKLEKLREELATIEKQWAKNPLYQWEAELDQLERAIINGRKTRWMYEESGKYQY